jgi:hypothetical protein
MKKFFNSIWKDIKSGENIDVYSTVLISVALGIAGIFGVVNFSQLASGILATLALLALGSLNFRHSSNEIRDLLKAVNIGQKIEKNSTINVNRKRLENAKTLDWMAVSFHTMTRPYEKELTTCLSSGGQIRLLLVDPTSDVPKTLAKLGYSAGDSEIIINDITSTLRVISNWKKKIPDCNIEVRYLHGQPPYRLTIVDRTQSNGYVRVRIPSVLGSEMPVITLHSSDEWYDFFVNQFEKLWSISKNSS